MPSIRPVLLVFVSCLASSLGAQQFVELRKQHVSARVPAAEAVLLDFDGDGDMDLVHGTGAVLVHQSAVRFDVQPPNSILMVRAAAHATAAGDLDGDADPDLVFMGGTPLEVVLYRNDLGRSFSTMHVLPGVQGDTDFVLLDVDRDRDLDLVVVSTQQNRLLVNDGLGGMTDVTASHMPRNVGFTSEIEAGDVDGDGDADLILAGRMPIAFTFSN